MENFRKLVKIAALDQKIPGPVCGDPDCEELCAEAFDAALTLRLDPMDVLRKTIQRELHCLPANAGDSRACRFGFRQSPDSLALGGEKKTKGKKDEAEIIHIFRTGGNECKDCRDLKNTCVTPEVWADEEKMRSLGFPKQENGEYLPHPHCKCHWEEEHKTKGKSLNDSNREQQPFSRKNAGKARKNAGSLTFYAEGEDFGDIPIKGIPFLGLKDLVEKIENGNYVPHSLSELIIINHSGFDNLFPLGIDKQGTDWTLHDLKEPYISRLKYYLNPDSIVEIRMCGTISGSEGKETVQRLADLLGCRVRAYGGYVSPFGTRPGFVNKEVAPGMKWYQRLYPDPEKKDFYPRGVDKSQR